MNKSTAIQTSKATQKNLYLDRGVLAAAEAYVALRKQTQRAFSLSQLVQETLVEELHKQGVKLPPEFCAQ